MTQVHVPNKAEASTIQLQPARIHTSGVTAGYVELTMELDSVPSIQELYDHLRLSVPGELELLRPTAHEEVKEGVTVTFFSAQISNSGRLPSTLEVHWIEKGDTWMLQIPFVQAPAQDLPEENPDAELPGD